MSHYIVIPGDASVPTLEIVKQIKNVDGDLVATVVREIVQFRCSRSEDELVCEIERLFPGGAALIRVKSLNLIEEA
jgi:hypothetical protein